MAERRQAILAGDAPGLWPPTSSRRAALVAEAGDEAVCAAERLITLVHLDAAWSEHLGRCADLREGIHLVRLGGQDPLSRFSTEATASFALVDAAVEARALASLDQIRMVNGEPDLEAAGVTAPASTWTSLVNDDPFKDQLGLQLTGIGGTTVAIFAAAVLGPLLVAWRLVDRLFGRRPPRRAR